MSLPVCSGLSDSGSCVFPTEGDRVCSWLLQWSPTSTEHCAVAPLQNEPSVPRSGPSHTGLHSFGETEMDVQGWCGPAGLQNQTTTYFLSTHIHPLPLPSSLLLTQLPPYQWQPVSGAHSQERTERKQGEERNGDKGALVSQKKRQQSCEEFMWKALRKLLTLLLCWGQSHYH